MFTKKEIELAPKVNEILTKLGWEWIPEMGEWCIYGFGVLGLVIGVRGKQWLNISDYGYELHRDSAYPILQWEKIEEILEKLGYSVEIKNIYYFYDKYEFVISQQYSNFKTIEERAKTRQEAVMKAVTKLGKEKVVSEGEGNKK